MLDVSPGGDLGVASRTVIEEGGLRYYSTEHAHGLGGDFVVDVERETDLASLQSVAPFGSS